mgnify:CR=1 FL=1
MKGNYKNTAVICLSHNNGGMELASIKIAQLLLESTDTTIIARKKSFIHITAKESDINIETVENSGHFSIKLIKEIREIVIRKNIKNVIFLGASELKSLFFSFLGLDINLIIRQGTYKKSSKKGLFHRLIYSNVKYFIANSKYIMSSMKKIMPLNNQSALQIIYASYEPKQHLQKEQENNNINIVHLGRIVKGKGQKNAVIACSKLKEKGIDFKCNFYGSIEDENYYLDIENYIKKYDLEDNVIFHGHTNNPTQAIFNSDVFLFPTKGEGFSNAMIEAISYGLIVLSYNNSSMPEMKEQGFNIHLVEDQNQNLLNKKLEYIIENLEKEKKLSHQNITLAKEFFSKEKERDKYLSLLI